MQFVSASVFHNKTVQTAHSNFHLMFIFYLMCCLTYNTHSTLFQPSAKDTAQFVKGYINILPVLVGINMVVVA